MTTLVDAATLIADAETAAATTAREAGVEVMTLQTLDDIEATDVLFRTVWNTGGAGSPMPVEVIRAVAHSGGYAAAAYQDRDIVGAAVGFVGLEPHGKPYLHSHVLGVLPSHRDRHVGLALKQQQRAWCLARRIERVTWTFDPLVRRNAWFNVTRLGADVARYYEHFYGEMTDGINAGDESDRVLASWELLAPRAQSAAAGRPVEYDSDALVAAGALVLVDESDDGSPVAVATPDASAERMLCRTPHDVVAIRRRSSDLALEWRRAVRRALSPALDMKFIVTGFTRDGFYVLEKRSS